jgi:hypothetical protein
MSGSRSSETETRCLGLHRSSPASALLWPDISGIASFVAELITLSHEESAGTDTARTCFGRGNLTRHIRQAFVFGPVVQTVEGEDHRRDKRSHEFSRILAGFHAESDPTVEFLRGIGAIRGKAFPPSLHTACGYFQCLNRSFRSHRLAALAILLPTVLVVRTLSPGPNAAVCSWLNNRRGITSMPWRAGRNAGQLERFR